MPTGLSSQQICRNPRKSWVRSILGSVDPYFFIQGLRPICCYPHRCGAWQPSSQSVILVSNLRQTTNRHSDKFSCVRFVFPGQTVIIIQVTICSVGFIAVILVVSCSVISSSVRSFCTLHSGRFIARSWRTVSKSGVEWTFWEKWLWGNLLEMWRTTRVL